jgi:GT2 family glycosyltransferase
MKATVVIVNYLAEDLVAQFIRNEMSAQTGFELQLVLVDNGHHNEDILRSLPGVQLLSPPRNLGYLGALQFAVSNISLSDSDYVILSNFDLHFNNASAIANLLQFGKENNLQVFGPQIVNLPSGAEANPMYSQRPGKSFYRRLLLATSFYPFYWIYQWLHILKKKTKTNIKQAKSNVYAIHGSMMVFDKTFIAQGNFEHPAFLYGEEILIAEQCRAANWNIGFHSETRVMHQEHSTTGAIKNKKHMRYLHESIKAIYRTYYA